MRQTWAEIDLKAFTHNIKEIRKKVGAETKILLVVKADGYGHGALKIAKKASSLGVAMFGVAMVEEALELQKAGINTPILILNAILSEEVSEVVRYDLRQTVGSFSLAEKLSEEAKRQNRKVIIHIKIDTGMGRIGFFPEEAVSFIKKIWALDNLAVEGIFTHFSSAEEKDKSFPNFQLSQFLKVIKELEKEGINISLKHTANSAAILDLPQTYLDMVRPGLIAYGLFPSQSVKRSINLQPVLSLKTKVVFLKKVSKGQPISYGRTYIAPEPTLMATVPIGYADGYPRLLSNQGEVIIKGKRVPVRGRVCMDQCMIEVKDIPGVKVGEEVVLIGKQGKEEIKVEEIAEKLNTIPYEIVCMLKKRVPRIYKEEEE